MQIILFSLTLQNIKIFQFFLIKIRLKIIQIKIMKQKNRKSISHKNKQQKIRIRDSFQKAFEENAEFDSYIDIQFKKMIQQKTENPTLIIPQGFKKFVQSKSFKQLLKRIYQYLEALIQFEQKYDVINQQEGQKMSQDPLFRPLRFQTSILQKKCKQISYAYMGILLGYGDSKMVFKDQYFFETMIYFLTQVLRQNFDQSQYNKVQQQLNRIFRTEAFNLIKRRHLQDNLVRKYPAIKQSKYDGTALSINKLESRLSLQKKNHYSMQIRSDQNNGITKPVQISLSTFHSIRRRSPLIASFYPSQRQKLFEFAKQVREKQSFIKTSRRERSFLLRRTSNFNLQGIS